MAQKSYSFKGFEWDSNAELIDWQCSRCKARFTLKKDGIQHIGAEHGEGTLYPRLNTSGRLRLTGFLPSILGMTKSEVLDMLVRDEPSVLESLGFRAETVKDLSLHTRTMEVPMPETPSIPSKLYQDLQTVLLRCGPFQSDHTLRPLFIDSRISAWRDDLPSATSTSKRVQAVIEYLWPQSNASGENALVLLLQVLRDQTSRGDACYGQLDALAVELETVLGTGTQLPPLPPPPKSLNGADKRRMVAALLACPTMSDRHTRDTVVNDLPNDIKNNSRRNAQDNVDISNIVTACTNYPNGVHELIETVRFYEGGSILMKALDALWKEVQ